MQGLAVIGVILISAHMINADCFASQIGSVKTLTGTKPVCPYEIKGKGIKLNFEIGSDFTLDCYKCTCSKDGLQCCGIGFYAGLMDPGPGCKVVQDGCDALFIKDGAKKPQDYKNCFTGEYIIPRKG